MKQVYQLLKTGELTVAEVPAPSVGPGMVLVRVVASLVSAGTERSMVDFAQKNLIAKARSRPDLVLQVMDKARREGLVNAVTAATQKLDRPQSLGYSCAGSVVEVGENVTSFRCGDRVACAGVNYANHAGLVSVPINLVARIPDGEVDFEEAAFTTVGTIAMHGLRLAKPQLGETVAIIGLGLVGLITVQLAVASGCRVVGFDPNAERCRKAEGLGCSAVVSRSGLFKQAVASQTANRGADSVIITAATESSEPVQTAAEVARSRARVVAVGSVGTTLPRKQYFEKELEFLISRSYGPGRYDPAYEDKGQDYPVEYVRWTENRNMESFLQLVADRKISLLPLITHRYQIHEAKRAYEVISGKTAEPFLGVVIRYEEDAVDSSRTVSLKARPPDGEVKSDSLTLGILGSGNFAQAILIPALQKTKAFHFSGICTGSGSTARYAGEKFNFDYCTTDEHRILEDPNIRAVVVATRHHLHARQVSAALAAGKAVFCEKPLCISYTELSQIIRSYEKANSPTLMVGFNRRFSPMAIRLREFVASSSEPMVVTYRVNGGHIPLNNWIQDPTVGGGRIVGEACHFIDLLAFITNSHCVSVSSLALPDQGRYLADNVVVNLQFANHSVATLTFTAAGDKSSGKECVEAFTGGSSAVLNDFRTLSLHRNGKRSLIRSRFRQDKGHLRECEVFAHAAQGASEAIPFASIVATTLTAFAIQESIATGLPADIDVAGFVENARTQLSAAE